MGGARLRSVCAAAAVAAAQVAVVGLWAAPCVASERGAGGPAARRLVTAQTRADAKALKRLQQPGKVFFQDGFETPASLKKYFEVRGLKDGRAKLVSDAAVARSGRGAIRFTAAAAGGRASGAGASAWFGPKGYGRVHFRRYVKFAADYNQGNLHHVGGGLAAVAGTDRWRAMGSAGIRPKGDDHFSSAFEPWRDWGRYASPGYMFLYTYWMDMKRDRDGNYWGNMLGPDRADRVALERGRWYCLEHMIQVNDVGESNGELAAWIDGRLYIHYTNIRWRSSAEVRLKRCNFGVYVHKARKDNTVWYDDVALSTGYVGPVEK